MNLQSASYTPNLLNQYTQRTVPGAVPVLGLAEAASTVTVNSGSTYRHGEYFWKELSAANLTVPVWQSVSVQAVHGANNNTVSGNVFVPQTPEAYSYDLDGNLTGDGRWSYTWDAENRLVRLVAATAVGPQQRIDFEYDAGSRRIRKKVWNNTSGTGTPATDIKFLYQGWNLIAELNALSSDAVIRSFVWGNDLSGTFQGAGGVGGLLAVKSGGVCHFTAYDGNGNVIALINGSTGTPSAQYEYGPFGEVIRATGPMARVNPFRWSTQYTDEETDLVMYPLRPYSPSTGRWLSRDPIGEAGGPNVYAFCVNDPLSFIDPFGDDFIAVADRPVKGTLGLFYHYSVQYWISCDDIELNTEYDIANWMKKNVAKKRESTELLADEGWKVWRFKGGKKWKLEDTKVSLIYYSDSGTKFAAIYKGTPQQVKQQWAKVIQQAKGYKYAEQPGFNGAFKNWPNSRYDVGDDVNNSNTYIRDIVKNSGMTMQELGGSHPGRNSPQPIPDDYGGQKPFKGPAPPQPPYPTPAP